MATTELHTLSLHDALPILRHPLSEIEMVSFHVDEDTAAARKVVARAMQDDGQARQQADELDLLWFDVPERAALRSEEHTSELQSRGHLVCRLLLEKNKKKK